MTDIEAKALALVNEVWEDKSPEHISHVPSAAILAKALNRAIEQHEAFKQEVSDAVEAVFAGYYDAPIPWGVMSRKLEPFIIAKPDPLVEAIRECWHSDKILEDRFRAALAQRGLEIVEKK